MYSYMPGGLRLVFMYLKKSLFKKYVTKTLCGPQSLKHLMFSPSQKEFAYPSVEDQTAWMTQGSVFWVFPFIELPSWLRV